MMKFRFCGILTGILLFVSPYAAYSGDSTPYTETTSETADNPHITDTHSDSVSQAGSTTSLNTASEKAGTASLSAESAAVARDLPTDTQEKSNTAAGTQNRTTEKSATATEGGKEAEKADSSPTPAALPTDPTAKTADTKESIGNSEKNTTAADSKTEPESEKAEKPDYSIGSISKTGLIVAEENRWYYEEFDRYGRPISAVLFEKDTELETTRWKYAGASHHPIEKTISAAGKSEQHIRYDTAGNITLIEQYDSQKKLIEKTENTYNSNNNLIEQIVFDGQYHDKTVWEYTKNKAVSQTKYRNNEKTVFIELLDDKRIVHVFVDGKEVFVTEEP